MTKQDLRDKLRERIDALEPRAIFERSAAICERLIAAPEYRKAEVVMIYMSLPREVDTSRIALQCWSDMKHVLAPKTFWDQKRMLPIEINSLTAGIGDGLIGIPEPTGGNPIPVADIDLVLVPGLAFDETGNRLGRGRGLYDRFLVHRDFHGISCGLGLEEQILSDVPVEEIDVRLDMLVSDVRVRRFEAKDRED